MESIRYAQEIVLRADRRLGEMLAETPKNPGGIVRSRRATAPPTLADVGLTKSEKAVEDAEARWRAAERGHSDQIAEPLRAPTCDCPRPLPDSEGDCARCGRTVSHD